jgi:hypothetical protein
VSFSARQYKSNPHITIILESHVCLSVRFHNFSNHHRSIRLEPRMAQWLSPIVMAEIRIQRPSGPDRPKHELRKPQQPNILQ